jgi:hypothetical protein
MVIVSGINISQSAQARWRSSKATMSNRCRYDDGKRAANLSSLRQRRCRALTCALNGRRSVRSSGMRSKSISIGETTSPQSLSDLDSQKCAKYHKNSRKRGFHEPGLNASVTDVTVDSYFGATQVRKTEGLLCRNGLCRTLRQRAGGAGRTAAGSPCGAKRLGLR